jgi:flagellar basal body-associated protein FliL
MHSKTNSNGSILIAIIITLTLMASLGGGMVYYTFTSSSTGTNLVAYYNTFGNCIYTP